MSDHNPPSDSESSLPDFSSQLTRAVAESHDSGVSKLIGDFNTRTLEPPLLVSPAPHSDNARAETYPAQCPGLNPSGGSCKSGQCITENIPPRIRDLILWKSPIHTAVVFGSLLALSISLMCHSVISVVAYLGLILLAVSLGVKVYGQFIGECTNSCGIISCIFNKEWKIPQDCAEKFVSSAVIFLNQHLGCVRDRFLFTNNIQSAKFALFLYFLTYVGAFFNLLTLFIIGLVELFTLPVIYVTYQREIDHILKRITDHVKEHTAGVREKLKDIPFIGPKLKGD